MSENNGAKRRGSKTSFVLGLAMDLPAKEVVAKAKEEGIDLSEKYVYEVRAAQRAKTGKPKVRKGAAKTAARRGPGRPKKSAAEKAPAAGKTSRKVRGPKREFVLSQPSSMTATEVVEAAKQRGMSLTANYVYNLRSGKGTPAPKAAAKASPPRAAVEAVGLTRGSIDAQFVTLALELGLARAADLLERVRSQARQLTSA